MALAERVFRPAQKNGGTPAFLTPELIKVEFVIAAGKAFNEK
jgi:hypothetical protein